MPVFSLAPEAGTSGRTVHTNATQRPLDPNAAIQKFIKDLDSHEKRYQADWKYLCEEQEATLDKMEEVSQEDFENLETIERDLAAIRLLRAKLSKLYAEESHNQEKPWVIGVRGDEETISWGWDLLNDNFETLLVEPLILECGEEVGGEAAKEFSKAMKEVPIKKKPAVVKKGGSGRTLNAGPMGMARMFDASQLNDHYATRQGHDKGSDDEGSDGSSTTNPSVDSFSERLAEHNKKNGSPDDTIEVVQRKEPKKDVDDDYEPISARRPKTKPTRAPPAERKILLQPRRETDAMVRGIFSLPVQPAQEAQVEPPHREVVVSAEPTSPGHRERDQIFPREESYHTESSDGLFVTQRPPRRPRSPRAPSPPSPPPREATPRRSQFMQGVVSSMGLAPSAVARRSPAPEPEARRGRGEREVDGPLFEDEPPNVISLLEESDLGEIVKERGSNTPLAGALGVFGGPMKKMKKDEGGGGEEGKSLGRVKWPGQKPEGVRKKGSKRK